MGIARVLFRKWWVIALQGLLLIILSVYIFQNSNAVLTGISFWLGVLVLTTGALGIVAWMAADGPDRDSLSLVWSILTAAFGLLMLTHMLVTMKAVTIVFGVWMLATGVQLAQSGWSLKDRSTLGWMMLGAGGLSAVAGTMMVFNIGAGAIGVSTLFGLQVMLAGIALVLLSLAKKVLVGKVKQRFRG